MAYATAADYEAWTGAASPVDIVRRLEEASAAVDAALINPLPVNEETELEEEYAVAARKNATLAQTVAIVEDAQRGMGGLSSLSIGPLSMTRHEDMADPRKGLDPVAESFLRGAGLLYRGVQT